MNKFRYEENGYNRQDVKEFVIYVIQEMESLIDKIKEQKEELKFLNEKYNQYEQMESELLDAYQRLDTIGEVIRNHAKEESDLIISEAKLYASRIVNDALKKAEIEDLDH